MLQKLALALAITSAFSLAGCGGGGGGGTEQPKPITCDADEVLVNNTCQPKPVTCDADEVLVNNTCQPKPVTCDADEVLVNNTCQPKPVTQSFVEVTAIDGYLHKALVWLDCDGDGVRDSSEVQAETNNGGVAKLDVTATPEAADCAVGVEAKANYTIDMDDGKAVASGYNLWAAAGSISNAKVVVTPFSTLVKFHSKDSTPAAAKTEVAAMLGIAEGQLDVDYIKLALNENGAIAANLVQIFPHLDFVSDGGWNASTVGSVVSEVATGIRTEFAKHSGESGEHRRKGIRVEVDPSGVVGKPIYIRPDDNTGGKICPDGQEKWNNQCVAVCEEGEQRNINGVCEETTVVCPDGEVLNGDVCVKPVECSVLETLVDGQCQPKICPEGKQLDASGECVTSPVQCDADEVFQNGVCVPKPVVCSIFEQKVDGVCVPKICPEGQQLNSQGQCETTPVVCEADEVLENGKCVPKPIICEADEVLTDGVCVPKVEVCDATQKLVDGKCVPICPEGQELNDAGQCVEIELPCAVNDPRPSCAIVCAEGQEKWNNTCVPACADNEIRGNDGTCAPIEECVIE